MAREQKIEPDKMIINGGNVYTDYIELEEREPLTRAIQRLHFMAFQHIQKEFGIWPNMEFGIHCKIEKQREEYSDKQCIRCRIETIPVIHEEYRVIMPVEHSPYSVQRKLNFGERIKILFKGVL